MKTKVLKFGLPLAVFMLAIVFAFATQNSTSLEEDALIAGFRFDTALNQCVSVEKDCTEDLGIPCTTILGEQIYKEDHDTFCDVQLYEWE